VGLDVFEDEAAHLLAFFADFTRHVIPLTTFPYFIVNLMATSVNLTREASTSDSVAAGGGGASSEADSAQVRMATNLGDIAKMKDGHARNPSLHAGMLVDVTGGGQQVCRLRWVSERAFGRSGARQGEGRDGWCHWSYPARRVAAVFLYCLGQHVSTTNLCYRFLAAHYFSIAAVYVIAAFTGHT
jgi:hypothetical protein